MKLNKVLFGVISAVVTVSVIAADPAPVIDMSNQRAGGSLSQSEQIASLERQIEVFKRIQVQNQRQLNDLQDEVSELRGITELHSHQLSQVLERQRELYQELERRVAQALKPATQVPATLAAPQGETTSYSGNLSENEAYDHAVNLVLKDKQYEQAIPAFKAFNQQFPNSAYAANAHYWLGQLLFNKGELAQAQAEFETVVNNFANSSKRSDAILKLAMVAQKQNDNTQAMALYRKVIADYPNSSAAKLAQPRLASLAN